MIARFGSPPTGAPPSWNSTPAAPALKADYVRCHPDEAGKPGLPGSIASAK